MNLVNIVSGTTGLLHLIASIIALIAGLFVLITPKGTIKHKNIGYLYAFSMVILNVTAFMIYRLFGKFYIFHWFAVISCLTLFAGMYPVLSKKGNNYLLTHFNFMYWSVIGLYCAFMAEIFTRLPNIIRTATGEPMLIFYKLVGVGIGVTMAIGIYFFVKYRPVWEQQYKRN